MPMQPRPMVDTLRPLFPGSRSVMVSPSTCSGKQIVWRGGPALRFHVERPRHAILWSRRLRLGRYRAEGPLGVALGATRPGQGALSLQFLLSQLPVVRTRQRREQRNEVVDVVFRQRQRLDVLIKPGICKPSALVVVVHHVPKGLL